MSVVPPVPPSKETVIGEFADAVLAEIESVAKPTIESLLTTGEADAVAGLSNLLKNLPKPSGIEGVIAAPIEAAFESAALSYAQAAVAKYGPTVIFGFIDAKLQAWAKSLGG